MYDYTDLDTLEIQRVYDAIGQELAARAAAKRKDVTEMIIELAASVGLTADQVLKQGNGGDNGKAPRAPKFRDPANPAQTWTGRGKRPGWFREHLAAGGAPADLLITSDL